MTSMVFRAQSLLEEIKSLFARVEEISAMDQDDHSQIEYASPDFQEDITISSHIDHEDILEAINQTASRHWDLETLETKLLQFSISGR